MATTSLTERASIPPISGDRATKVLGHPGAFLLTAAVLLTLFGATFVANPDRVAPTRDPAFYTWRTEALLSEPPVRLIELVGPLDLFGAGYRVTVPVLGGLLRSVGDVSTLKTTALLMVVLPVITALLMAGFAYRKRPDPLVWHAVALGGGSLLLTPPFVGYMDNVLTLFFLAAALNVMEATRTSWPARISFGLFLLASGLTHTTTLIIFGMVLGAMAVVRLIYRRFDIASVIRDDGWMLASALGAAIATALVWIIGIWGLSAPLGEAALAPPYEKDFFLNRLGLWIDAMRPLLNGPLFVIGAVGLLAAGRRAAEDDLARVSIVWLAPLAGVFGFLAGLSYPYYRFFNTTLAWVLLVAVGMYFAARFFIAIGAKGGVSRFAFLGLVALAFVIGTNFTTGFRLTGWNNANGGWLSAAQRTELDALRAELTSEDPDRPVVFVFDKDDPSPRIYGYTKLSGNTARYGLPPRQIDQAHFYLGSLDNYLRGAPTLTGESTYELLSRALLEESDTAIADSGREPIVVLAASLNESGANAGLTPELLTGVQPSEGDLWVASGGSVSKLEVGGPATIWQGFTPEPSAENGGVGHILVLLGVLALMLVPGALLLKWLVPDAGIADALGMIPALSVTFLALIGIGVLAVARNPLSTGLGWITLGVTIIIAAALRWSGGREGARGVAAGS